MNAFSLREHSETHPLSSLFSVVLEISDEKVLLPKKEINKGLQTG